MKFFFKFIVFIAIPILLVGCGSTSNLNFTENYNLKKLQIKDDERVIYLIRDKNFFSGMHDFVVECNEKKFIVKKRGEYIPCKTTQTINNLGYSIVQPGIINSLLSHDSDAMQYFLTLDNPSEKEYFYLLKPLDENKGFYGMKQISDNEGKALIGSDNYSLGNYNSYKSGINYKTMLLNPSLTYYIDYVNNNKKYFANEAEDAFNLQVEQKFQDLKKNQDEKNSNYLNTNSDVLNSEKQLKHFSIQEVRQSMSVRDLVRLMLSKSLMEEDNANKQNSDANSKIIIYRTKDNGSFFCDIWTKDSYIGGLHPESHIEIITQQSSLTLLSYVHKWNKFSLKLEKGKTYYINADFSLGWSENSLEFLIKSKDDFIKENTYKIKTRDNMPENYKDRIKLGLQLISNEAPL